MNSKQDTTGSQSVERALKLLSLVGRSTDNGMSLNEIVQAGGFNKATTRRLLLALIRARLVEQDDIGGRYFLGEEAYVLGTFAANRFGLLEMSMESLIRISRQTGDTSFLSIRRHTHSICLHREEGTFPIRSHVLQKGFEHPLGIGAASLAMLAALEDEEVEAVMAYNAEEIARDFPSVPPDYIRNGIASARTRGYAVNPGMIYPNSWAIGIALRYPDRRLAGAISVTAIDSRMQEPRQQELAAILRDEAAYIETKLAQMIEPERRASRLRPPREKKRSTPTRRLSL
ncbi:transcriptional regulator, IclR family (plasmid) [Rhizobium leguminosarum bv. trifolii WSM2304]|uniref:Transcriptional regulator, IclR family n=1 Tax=Rhizobium leguminosarum bv. trifolii (strain WSM2304) TaxID=395492 RepID=A0ABF7QYZ9_RHILW|nr:IclR family transcriptional regulator [Rhizobium leguminosarum]ACI59466.1 transcriptional regulator, IclR family [Rhizobium leguminosarum bv. trifolii WSM2304]